LAIFICLTNMILQFLYLTFWFLVLLCLTLIFWHLNSQFLLGSRIPSFYSHAVRFFYVFMLVPKSLQVSHLCA
jgi:hypothetical protein